MRRRSLLAVGAAALTLTVTAGLAVTGCGTSRMTALHANCTTKGLRWKLTVLKKKPHTVHREARLSIANTGAGPCVFRGFPAFEVHVGKGPESGAVGHGKTLPIDLPRGGTVLAPLRYKDCPKGTPPSAGMVSNDTAVVSAPRDYPGRQAVVARDEAGKRLRMTLCADRIWMDPPREAAE
ncbi:DUF4232 domain-containing protein [Streptomyces decoyicus]|uniref:DUF4232 domain-containing protein n=2 Tax=Streptomyces decoyicus TaxID=249567 RepID=A0ABZ1FKR7_9ACTN|nr:DUF4232 domain-containing protein [Streptomyces decoyicus]WSB71024.1 DUF4232 domain-containing protein [Streptomyces decoyicus]